MSFGMWGVPSPTDPPAPESLYGMKHAFAREFLPATDGSVRCEPVEFPPPTHATLKVWLRGFMCQRNAEGKKDAQELLDFIEENPQGFLIWVGDWMDGPYGDAVDPHLGVEEPVEQASFKRSASRRVELEDHQMFGSGD